MLLYLYSRGYFVILIYLIYNNNVYPTYPIEGTVSWDSSGDNQLQFSVKSNNIIHRCFTENIAADVIVFDYRVVWRGKLESIRKNNKDVYRITAYGLLKQLDKINDYTEFFSISTFKDAYYNTIFNSDGTSSEQYVYESILQPDAFTYTNNTGFVQIGLKKNASIGNTKGTAIVQETPIYANNRPCFNFAAFTYNLPASFYVLSKSKDIADNQLTTTLITTTSGIKSVAHNIVTDPSYTAVQYGIRNNTGGTYTVTAEENAYYLNLNAVRLLSTGVYSISGRLSAQTSPGTITLNIPNASIGDGVYFISTVSGEYTNVIDVTPTTCSVVTSNPHASGGWYIMPRMHATEIISNICSHVGLRTIYLDYPDKDIKDANYQTENAKSVLDRVCKHGSDTTLFKVVGTGDTAYVVSDSFPTYYVDLDVYTIEKLYAHRIASARSVYTTAFGVERATDNVAQTVSNGSYRTESYTSNYTTSGAALNEVRNTLHVYDVIPIKSDIKTSRIYNSAGGLVDYPLPGSRIIIRNILPELLGIDKYKYYLSSIVLDVVTGAKQYVIGDYIDNIESILAN